MILQHNAQNNLAPPHAKGARSRPRAAFLAIILLPPGNVARDMRAAAHANRAAACQGKAAAHANRAAACQGKAAAYANRAAQNLSAAANEGPLVFPEAFLLDAFAYKKTFRRLGAAFANNAQTMFEDLHEGIVPELLRPAARRVGTELGLVPLEILDPALFQKIQSFFSPERVSLPGVQVFSCVHADVALCAFWYSFPPHGGAYCALIWQELARVARRTGPGRSRQAKRDMKAGRDTKAGHDTRI